MNAGCLFALYDRVADAPDTVLHLRQFILDLTVQGKLLGQNPKDRPTSELLKNDRIKICKDNFNWLASDIGTLLNFKYGKAKLISECSKHGPIPVYGSNGIVSYCETALIDCSSIIIIGRKGSAGTVNKSSVPAWITDVAYYVLTPGYFDKDYLYWALKGAKLDSLAKGVKPGLSRSDAYKIPIRVPPLAEQHRIVAKVNELMALCDEIEASRTKKESIRENLTISCLGRLTDSKSSEEEFRNHARFVMNNISPLTVNAKQIRQFRTLILELAVRGKLVEQDSDDEPASELLNSIHHEHGTSMSKNISCPTTKRDTPIEEYSPFEIPDSWSWISIGETGRIFSGNSTNQTMKENLSRNKSGYPYIMTKDIGYGFDPLNYENNMN